MSWHTPDYSVEETAEERNYINELWLERMEKVGSLTEEKKDEPKESTKISNFSGLR